MSWKDEYDKSRAEHLDNIEKLATLVEHVRTLRTLTHEHRYPHYSEAETLPSPEALETAIRSAWERIGAFIDTYDAERAAARALFAHLDLQPGEIVRGKVSEDQPEGYTVRYRRDEGNEQ